ncbi:MAG TPA: NAD(P)-dependent oxidoreductase [Terriglobales bacterium]|nr:NAD(P)-dependent oxidoreductase [Terriglobales bacterium]
MDQNDIVIITGSSGLIGNPTVKRLASHCRVVGFDRRGSPHPRPEAECVCVDVTDDESVRAGFARVRYAYGPRIAAVIHLAAYYDFSGEPSSQYEEVTVRGTERLLRALQAFDVGLFVFSSTMLVHAPCLPGQRIDEGWPLEPKWDYPKSKVITEQVVHAERGQIPSVILRIAGVYNDHCHSIPLAQQIQRIAERKLTGHIFPGDITHGQAFVHLDDLVEAVSFTVDRRSTLPPETVLLIGESVTLSYDELQRSFGRLIHNEEWETREIPKSVAKAGAWLENHVPGETPFIKPWMIDLADDHYALDVSRAQELIKWSPARSLGQTLPKMIEFLKADHHGFYSENKLDAAGAGSDKRSTASESEVAHDG